MQVRQSINRTATERGCEGRPAGAPPTVPNELFGEGPQPPIKFVPGKEDPKGLDGPAQVLYEVTGLPKADGSMLNGAGAKF